MPTPNTDDLIALICKAATEKYREDRVRPGIQIAHIPAASFPLFSVKHGESVALVQGAPDFAQPAFWYVALHRYPNDSYGGTLDRVAVCKAEHADLDRAIQLLAVQLIPATEAQAELAEAITPSS
jgi:hypothetical protein